MEPEKHKRKGLFGRAGLPLSAKYLYPRGRSRMLAISAVLAVAVLAVFLVNLRYQRGSFVSGGPLSSGHATLEPNCAACHTPLSAVSSAKCSVCHEKFTERDGVHSFNVHYVYTSGDRTRAHVRGGEVDCVACHTEHRGRIVTLRAQPASQCQSCHKFSFASGHPEFEFAAKALPDDANLAFTHIKHIERVMDERHLTNHELACLSCHNTAADGRLLEPIDFDKHCARCHLGAKIQTDWLDIAPRGTQVATTVRNPTTLNLGVETLDTIRRRLGPGEAWSLATSEARFEVDRGRVREFGVQHRDPWILHNLKRLRRAIYPAGELSDLLVAAPAAPPGGKRELYREALATLRAYADGLRGRPSEDVQQELAAITTEIDGLSRRIESPDTQLSDSRFRSDLPASALSADAIQDIGDFAAVVAKPCLECHRLDRAAIVRVQVDQRVMRRARFDHRAHVSQRDCLSCHNKIAVFDHLGVPGAVPAEADNAGIQNLPTIAECRTCHAPGQAADTCVTCHDFHPIKDQLSRLVLE